MSNAMIKQRYNVEKEKLKCIRKAMGLPIKHGGYPLRGAKLEEKKKYKKQIYQDFLNGATILDLMKKYNRSRQYINSVRREGEKCNTANLK
jgi:Mor family transcriptional regulator